MIQRIQFQGSKSACAKWLPFAKKKLRSLSQRYGSRKHWTWERKVPGARISLEQNGSVQYIRIVAYTGGYEFSTSFGVNPGVSLTRLYDMKFGVVRPYSSASEPGEKELQQRHRGGNHFGDDEYGDQVDAFLFGRQWSTRYAAGDDFTYPMVDWFAVEPVIDQAEADERALRGYKASKRAITLSSDTGRYHDHSCYFAWVDGGLGASSYGAYSQVEHAHRASQGPIILHRKGRNSIPLDTLGDFNLSAAVQGEFVLGGVGPGQDYEFFFYHQGEDLYWSADLSALKPDWVYGSSRTRWYWRGDGKKCISLQYDPYSTDPDKLQLNEVIIDVGIQELDISGLDIDEDNNLLGAISQSFVVRGFEDFRPIAVDYDILDGKTRRVVVLEPWIGPIFTRLPVYSEYYSPSGYPCRSILIYAHLCTIDDLGIISAPERSFPVYHKPWLAMNYIDPPDGSGDEFGYDPVYGGHALGADSFLARFGNHGFMSRIVAMDVRAQALAFHTQVQTEDYPPGIPSVPVPYTCQYNKRWTIWGEAGFRENTWADAAGVEFTPGADPIDALATPPVDYVRYETSHPIWQANIIGQDLNPFFEEIIRSLYDVDNAQSSYDGFRVSPRKHFSLFVSGASGWYVKQEPTGNGGYIHKTEMPAAAESFLQMDHVEWYRLDDDDNPDPLTSTHYELFNNARTAAHVPGDGSVVTMCANGFWGE